ncbi:MAG: MoaD/ThiS family protein [Phycisphaerales bacterium]
MTVEVLLFGPEAAATGRERVSLELASSAPTPADLRAALGERFPKLIPTLPAARFAVNGEFAHESTCIRPGDEVALIGMVSGG